ncbi:hypothetical protein AB4865_05020 [Capnocytophaga sp. ARDL2]
MRQNSIRIADGDVVSLFVDIYIPKGYRSFLKSLLLSGKKK